MNVADLGGFLHDQIQRTRAPCFRFTCDPLMALGCSVNSRVINPDRTRWRRYMPLIVQLKDANLLLTDVAQNNRVSYV